MIRVVAVLDIGKTNKKLLLFDERLEIVHEESRHIDTIEVDGLAVEDVATIEQWFLEELRRGAARFDIRAITVATHGATVVCVGEDGLPAVAPIAYTNEVDEAFHERFAAAIGEPADLHDPTATAEVRPLINAAKLIFFTRERYPERFARTRQILMYPQYLVARLTGVNVAEVTYVGSHTYLLDPRRLEWSSVVDRLGIRDLLPPTIGRPGAVAGPISRAVADATGLAPDTPVLAGIHDSNASILPYLITRTDEFVLNSTGTWCVAMHPTDTVAFGADEIGKMVFFNVGFEGQPIKTSILMGGAEYDAYHALLSTRHPGFTQPPFDAAHYGAIASEADLFVVPSVVFGAGQFPASRARVIEGGRVWYYDALATAAATGRVTARDGTPPPAGSAPALPPSFLDPARAIAAVNLSVAIQTTVALERAGLRPGVPVYTEGGFRRNDAYLALLAALLPENPIVATSVAEATSLGAALLATAAVEGRPVRELADRIVIEERPVAAVPIAGLAAYRDAFLANV